MTKCDQSLKFSALEKVLDVSDDEDVQEFRGGQYVRPAEGKLTERLSDEQAFEPVYGDDFSDNIKEMSYEDFVKEREKDWGDPADAFDMSNTSSQRKVKDRFPNLIFSTWETVDRPRQVVVSDMTAFKFWYFYFEITFYFDVFTKEILSWQMAERRGAREQYMFIPLGFIRIV